MYISSSTIGTHSRFTASRRGRRYWNKITLHVHVRTDLPDSVADNCYVKVRVGT